MQKIERDPELHLGAVGLSFQDLKDIIGILNELGECESIKITIGDYQFESLEDLAKYSKTISNQISITWRNYDPLPRLISIFIRSSQVYINGYRANASMKGVIARIEKILQRKRKLINPLGNIKYVFVPLVILYFVLLLFKSLFNQYFVLLVALLVIIVSIPIWLSVIPGINSKLVYSEVQLVEHSKKKSLWVEHKGEIYVGIIVGVIMTILSAITTYIVTIATK